MEVVDIASVKLNPNNPRIIKDDKFKKLVQSVKDFPEMLNIRPIVVNLDPKYCDVIVKRMIKLDDTLTVKRNGIDCINEFKA